MPQNQTPPVFRFAPSPNGFLHLGHAFSALLNEKLAHETGGNLLVRIEDVDRQRSRQEYEQAILEDLEWLGIKFDEAPRRQSEYLAFYKKALEKLIALGFAYASKISRSEIASLAANAPNWPRDPDGAFLPPISERRFTNIEGAHAIRLNMDAALVNCPATAEWSEGGQKHYFDPRLWGDIVLKSRDGSFAYHLAVVVDDAAQNVTNIVRGRDLYAATAIHRLLQTLLGFPAPIYLHHELILDTTGEKLAKSKNSPTLRALRAEGLTPSQIRRQLGFSA